MPLAATDQNPLFKAGSFIVLVSVGFGFRGLMVAEAV